MKAMFIVIGEMTHSIQLFTDNVGSSLDHFVVEDGTIK